MTVAESVPTRRPTSLLTAAKISSGETPRATSVATRRSAACSSARRSRVSPDDLTVVRAAPTAWLVRPTLPIVTLLWVLRNRLEERGRDVATSFRSDEDGATTMPPEAARGKQEHQQVLALEHISKTFGGVRALHDVDLTIRRGEVHGLLGENGSGKSTLIKILAGFHAPDGGGALEINGRPVSLPLTPGQFRRLGMSFVHQDLGLVGALSVVENLVVGDLASRRRWRLSWARERRRAQETFKSFGLKLDPSAKVSDLRPTDRALLAIVRAVEEIRANTADDGSEYGLLVLDEPTVFLPASDRDALFALVRDIAATRASILFVSHDLDEILEITDRVTVLRDGTVRGTVDTAQATDELLVEMIIGRRLQALSLEREPTEAGKAISITGLTGRYARNVSLTVREGEVVGLTGLLGSGFEEIPYYVFGARSA